MKHISIRSQSSFGNNAVGCDVNSRDYLVAGSQLKAEIFHREMPEMNGMLMTYTSAAREPLDRFDSNGKPICALIESVCQL